MLTNIVAAITVSVVTNVSEQVTGYARHVPAPCPNADPTGITSCLVNHWKGVDPTHKTITTNVVEITTLTFDWLGQKRELKSEKILETKSSMVALQWVITTNAPAAPTTSWGVWDNSSNYIFLTNGISGGTIFLKP